MSLSHSELLQLKRWNTPTIYNGWEQITRRDCAADAFNLEETRDFMPQMGPMIGYAITLVIEPSHKEHKQVANAWEDYRKYVASQAGPKIVVVQDNDKPQVIGAFWGEVNSNVHRALGCVGTIPDGAIRDVDEMTNAGFMALARRLCVGHAHSIPVQWGCEVGFGWEFSPETDSRRQTRLPAVDASEQGELLEASAFGSKRVRYRDRGRPKLCRSLERRGRIANQRGWL